MCFFPLLDLNLEFFCLKYNSVTQNSSINFFTKSEYLNNIFPFLKINI